MLESCDTWRGFQTAIDIAEYSINRGVEYGHNVGHHVSEVGVRVCGQISEVAVDVIDSAEAWIDSCFL